MRVSELAWELDAVSLCVWPCAEAWAAWRRSAGGASAGAAVSLLQRAQVASLLGTQESRDVRSRLSGRRASSNAAAGVRLQRGTVRSPYSAACEVRIQHASSTPDTSCRNHRR